MGACSVFALNLLAVKPQPEKWLPEWLAYIFID
jgi:hypothetical protein